MKIQKAPYPATRKKKAFFTILSAGLIAGTLDICSAILIYAYKTDNGPELIFRYIASGLLGKAAFSGGVRMAWTGLALHFIITFIFALFLFFIYPRIRRRLKDKFIIGIFYGFFIWLVMNLIILPLSMIPGNTITVSKIAEGIITLAGMVGIPLSLVFHKFYIEQKKPKRRSNSKSL